MDASKRKVTAKLTSHNANGLGSTSTLSPSPPPQLVVRAKVSGTARTRTKSTASAPPSVINNNANLRPQARATTSSSSAIARRSPSPSKFQPQSALHKPVRVPLSKTATAALKPNVERSRHGSISSMLSMGATLKDDTMSSTSAPTTPISRETPLIFPSAESHAHPGPAPCANLNSGSLRIKAKVSGLAKSKPPSSSPVPPSLATIISPPSPSSSAIPVPVSATSRPRTRTTSTTSRRPSISISGPLHHAQLVPLPTSPPASTLSFSSHSSTSASGTSAHSFSTSTTPPLAKHVRAESLSMVGELSRQLGHRDEEGEMSPLSPTEPRPSKRNLVARVRPGTSVSGGRGWNSAASSEGWTGSNVSSGWRGHGFDDADPDQAGDQNESDADADETARVNRDETDQEDDVRAEAKSNRKIADLEITTRSLLAINASLETTKVRQAREIRDLRRRLRETRLVLPPRAYRQLQERDPEPTSDDPDPDHESDEDDGHGTDEDEGFARLRALVEGLLDAGRKALAEPAPSALRVVSPRDEGGPGGASAAGRAEVLGWETGGKHGVAIGSRVLSPEEARGWVEDEGEGGGEGKGVQRERERTEQDEEQGDGIDTPLPSVTPTEGPGTDAEEP